MLVQDIMSAPAVTCRVSESLDRAARLMSERDCGFIPIVDDAGAIAGILTDRDICLAACALDRTLKEILVAAVMSCSVLACRPGDPLEVAERLMGAKRIRRLPVLNDEGRPIGVITLGDIARCSARGDAELEHEVLRSFAIISRPRRQSTEPVARPPLPWGWQVSPRRPPRPDAAEAIRDRRT